MSAITMVGSITLALNPATLDQVLLPLVAFAAGSLISGVLLHMNPAAVIEVVDILKVEILVVAGFTRFLLLFAKMTIAH